jgi:lipoprotein-anchoring transpeptidase ErfK/SrfK
MVLAGIAWLAWERGWFGRTVKNGTAGTNALAEAVRTNSFVSTTVVVRSVLSIAPTNSDPIRATSVLDAQIALDRLGISCGSIDGVMGSQTRGALRAFQRRERLPHTGELDADTRARITLVGPTLVSYRVESADLARLLPLARTWLGKSDQPRLDYESLLECVAEQCHTHPDLVRRLNAGINLTNVTAGTALTIPATERARPSTKAAFIEIRLSERTLEAFDSANRMLAHFPCSIAARVEKRPMGDLHVAVVAPHPNYIFDPDNFPESPEARELGRKLKLEPGPNNPVGSVWIGLDKPGYGIHGTPKPEDVGRTESHGCFRLANWNAEYLLQLVTVGTPVRVEP